MAWLFQGCHFFEPNLKDSDASMSSKYLRCFNDIDIEYFGEETDIRRYQQLMRFLPKHVSHEQSIDKIIRAAGLFFLETNYVAHTLDQSDEERLIIHLDGVDCVTFVEYVVAASLVYRSQQTGFDDFATMVQRLRYKNGQIIGYASRLHYFSDWLLDNAKMGIIEVISNEIGTKSMSGNVSFMSSNPHLYRQLNDDYTLKAIQLVEQELAMQPFKYIPKADILLFEDKIRDGDVIAFVTDITGLDVSHTGFAFHNNSSLHLLHASSRSKRVEVTSKSLYDYLADNTLVSGILVARVL